MSCPRTSTAGCHLFTGRSPVKDLEVVIQALADLIAVTGRTVVHPFIAVNVDAI